ncbi:hypothetical protein H4R35_007163 [Dimargaris xerosporica]|nr:hypothetical protein H4R35_007163 [Dimargaris xerosporica]
MSAANGFKRKQAFESPFARKRAVGEHAFSSPSADGFASYDGASLHASSASPMHVDPVHSVPAASVPATSNAHLSVERPRPSGRPYRAWSSCIFGSESEAWF